MAGSSAAALVIWYSTVSMERGGLVLYSGTVQPGEGLDLCLCLCRTCSSCCIGTHATLEIINVLYVQYCAHLALYRWGILKVSLLHIKAKQWAEGAVLNGNLTFQASNYCRSWRIITDIPHSWKGEVVQKSKAKGGSVITVVGSDRLRTIPAKSGVPTVEGTERRQRAYRENKDTSYYKKQHSIPSTLLMITQIRKSREGPYQQCFICTYIRAPV